MKSFRTELIELIEQRAIEPENIDQAVDVAQLKPTGQDWLRFLNQLVIWIGLVTFGLAIIFFVAHNWSQIGKMTKFAIVEVSLVVTIIGYCKAQSQSLLSRACLVLSALLVGALLALFGQTYQTGADTWQLFAMWALIISPWVVISRFIPMWAIWFALINLSLYLYFQVHFGIASLLFWYGDNGMWPLFLFNLVSLVVWYKCSASIEWMRSQWLLRALAVMCGTAITYLVMLTILDNEGSWLALGVWTLFLASLYLLFRKIRTDVFILAGGCLSGLFVALTLAIRMLEDVELTLSYLILFALVAAIGGGAATWLKSVQEQGDV